MVSDTEKVKAYLEDNLLVEFDENTTENTNLFEEGYLDSYGFIELIGFLEGEFKFKFSNAELMSNKLASLSSIMETVRQKSDS